MNWLANPLVPDSDSVGILANVNCGVRISCSIVSILATLEGCDGSPGRELRPFDLDPLLPLARLRRP